MSEILDYLNSEKGQKDMDVYMDLFANKQIRLAKQLERFHSKFGDPNKFNQFIEKVITKYNSDEYQDRWYKRSIEPQESLYWFLYEYAFRYGRECNEEEWDQYGNIFTSSLVTINRYYFNRMNGQGSAIIITRLT